MNFRFKLNFLIYNTCEFNLITTILFASTLKFYGILSFVYPVDAMLSKILQHFEGVSIVHPKLTKLFADHQTVSYRLKVNEIIAN